MNKLEMILGQAVIFGLTAGVLYWVIKNEYEEEKKDFKIVPALKKLRINMK
jgi:hypothetical protein